MVDLLPHVIAVLPKRSQRRWGAVRSLRSRSQLERLYMPLAYLRVMLAGVQHGGGSACWQPVVQRPERATREARAVGQDVALQPEKFHRTNDGVDTPAIGAQVIGTALLTDGSLLPTGNRVPVRARSGSTGL